MSFPALDYDSGEKSFSLVVGVTDGTTSLQVTVLIEVTPVNEATPDFTGVTSTVSVAENLAVSSSVLSYAASDTDASPHGIKKYSIQSGSRIRKVFLRIGRNENYC